MTLTRKRRTTPRTTSRTSNSGAQRVALLLGIVALAVSCERTPHVSGPLSHAAYIWQRDWRPEVAESVRRCDPAIGELVSLGAEFRWENGRLVAERIPVRFDALKESAREIGFALRVGALPASASRVHVKEEIVRVARLLLREAKGAGIAVREIQLDYDCAESRLDEYERLAAELRDALAPVPAVITALPSWLDRPAFARLVHTAGEYILQVHAAEPPLRDCRTAVLCDPAQAKRWVERAGRIGVPFRVALPTYTCFVSRDERSKQTRVYSEPPLVRPNGGIAVFTARADAAEMFDLLRDWTGARPAAMRGVIWYRLPVTGDVWNWRAATLNALLRGERPRADLRLRTEQKEAADVILENTGNDDAPLPDTIEASWAAARLVSIDGSRDYDVAASGDHVDFRYRGGEMRLSPGARRNIGWLRLDPPAAIELRLGAR